MTTKQTTSTRDQLRGEIFSSKHKRGKSKKVPFNGVEIEIRQPNVAQLEDMMDATSDTNLNLTTVLIDYAYVPGTNDKVFEEGDLEAIRQMPFTQEMAAIVSAMENLVDLEVEESAKN